MSTLYLSDLDGTLFTTKKNLSERTVSLLTECIEAGAQFAVATARMPYGCDYRLKELPLHTPSILTNGVFIYDFNTKSYLSTKTMDTSSVHAVLDAFQKLDTGVFLYILEENEIRIFYNREDMASQTQYYSDRALECCKSVEYLSDLSSVVKEDTVFYLACTDTEEKLKPIHDAIANIPGISCAYYLNIYNGLYCIEIFSDRATKKHALLELKEMLGCDEVVVFGDNLNDLSMFEVADRCYAVENSLDVVKEQATKIIPGCDEDGVALFLHKEIIEGCK
jgi:Cof subfamily protein (haloacid dehalogenase superfamily)